MVAAVVTPYKTASSMITSEVNSIAFDEAATTVEQEPSAEKIEKLINTLISLRGCRGSQLKEHHKQICAEHLATYGSLIALKRHDKLIKQGLLHYFMKPGDIFETKRNKYGKGRDAELKKITRKATVLYSSIVNSIAKDQGISIQKSSPLTSSSNVSSQREQQQTADRFEFSGGNNPSQSPEQSEFLEKEPIDETIDSDDTDANAFECLDSVDIDSDEDSKGDHDGVESDDDGDDKIDSENANSGDGDDKRVDRDADFDDTGHDNDVDNAGCGAGIKEGVDNDGDGIDSNVKVDGNNVDRDGKGIKGDSVDRDCGDDEEGVGVDSDEDDEEGDEDEYSDEDFEEEDSDRKNKKAVTESDESHQEGPATRSAIKRRSSSGSVEMQYSFTDTMASDTVEKRPLFTYFKRNTDPDDEEMSPVVGSQSDSTSNRHKFKKKSCFGYIVFIKDQVSNWVKVGVGSGRKLKCCSRYSTAYPGTVAMIW